MSVDTGYYNSQNFKIGSIIQGINNKSTTHFKNSMLKDLFCHKDFMDALTHCSWINNDTKK